MPGRAVTRRGDGGGGDILTDRRTSYWPIDASRCAAHCNAIIPSPHIDPTVLYRPASSEVLVKSTRAARILGAATIALLLGWVMILCPLSADAEPVSSGPAVVTVQQSSRITVTENALDHRRRHSTLCSPRWVGRWYKWWCIWLD